MTEDNTLDIIFGLAPEEREDLEKLIEDFKAKPDQNFPDAAALEVVERKIESLTQGLSQLGHLVMQLDCKAKTLREIMELSFEKTELMNQRIDAIVAAAEVKKVQQLK